ncbi:MAG TPA: Asp-tRNA(Asn)/Glu-tRNA(Gln) amidotransferase subunit GatC [Vicinamibacterales bacterium]|nr:Asp-tRNA(Asn)/Glu-tRNA(Gln) amidotransferase subunit GatC [Vicinamibacterales bacterium]
MPDFTDADVRRLARLARLELTEREVALFTRQLGEILAFARQVQAVGAGGLTPGSDAAPAPREDVVQPSLPAADALGGAPAADGRTGLFKVPRVLNG